MSRPCEPPSGLQTRQASWGKELRKVDGAPSACIMRVRKRLIEVSA